MSGLGIRLERRERTDERRAVDVDSAAAPACR